MPLLASDRLCSEQFDSVGEFATLSLFHLHSSISQLLSIVASTLLSQRSLYRVNTQHSTITLPT